nr:MAG TPA: tail length tape measure protein [Caudoviricetes sp.]
MADTASLVARVTAEGAATAAKQLDNFAASATKAEAATDKMTPAVKEAAATTPKFGSAVTNVSYQLQDFIVQVSSGQSALLAFSQQAPQLLSGFGALGAVLGIAAAATSVLYNAFGSTNEATKNLESSTKALNAVIQTSKTGVTELSDSYIQLATGVETATASQAQLEAGIAGAENTIAAMNAKLKETADISYLMSGSITGANDSLQKGQTNTSSYTGFLSSLADQFGVTKQQAEELIPLLASVAEKPTQDNVLALTTRMGELSSATDSKVTPAFRNFRAELLNAIATQDTAKKSLDILKAAQLGQAEATNSSTEATKQNITKMIEYAQAQLQGAKAVLAFNAAQDKQQFAQSGATAEQIAQYNELINKQYEKDVANYDAAQQKKAEAEAKSAAARAKSEADRQAAQEKQADAFLTLVKKQNSSEVEQVTIAAAEKQKQLDDYYAKGLVSQQEYETASADIANAAQEKKDAIVAKEQEQQAKRQEQADAYLAQLQANFEGESAELDRQYQVKQDKLDKFHEEGLISEEDYQNALADLRQQKADALIAADLSTWGTIAANVKNAASENTALYKAAAITEATISTYLAATKALATGGPILGPILAASTIALGLANVAKISSAREQGGQLSAGQASTIAERGKPEVIMPAGASRVRTAQQMKEIMGQNGSSSGPSNVTIVNNTSSQIGNVSTEQDDEGRLRIIISEQVAAELQNSNSKISKARKATRNAPGFK